MSQTIDHTDSVLSFFSSKRAKVLLCVAALGCVLFFLKYESKHDKLCAAIRSRDVAKVRVLLEAGVSPNYQPRTGLREPLNVAISEGDIEIVKELLAHGADAEGDLNPPLCFAAT